MIYYLQYLCGVSMKILVFSDLHGNLNSLNALLKTEDYREADKTIFLGDVTFGCSRANDCITLLDNENITCILGNNDRYIVYNHIASKDSHTFNEGKHSQMQYMLEHISQENKDIMKSWLMDIEINVYGKTLYFTHYPWLDLDNDPYAAPCPSIHTLDNIKPLFEGITADYIIFGHEHIKYELGDQNTTYYCIDTLGLKEPGDYLVIDCNEERIEFNYKHLDFDMDSEISLIDNAGYPYDKSKIRKKK